MRLRLPLGIAGTAPLSFGVVRLQTEVPYDMLLVLATWIVAASAIVITIPLINRKDTQPQAESKLLRNFAGTSRKNLSPRDGRRLVIDHVNLGGRRPTKISAGATQVAR